MCCSAAHSTDAVVDTPEQEPREDQYSTSAPSHSMNDGHGPCRLQPESRCEPGRPERRHGCVEAHRRGDGRAVRKEREEDVEDVSVDDEEEDEHGDGCHRDKREDGRDGDDRLLYACTSCVETSGQVQVATGAFHVHILCAS